MTKREKKRDDREFDQTQLRENGHGRTLHRDYSAHFFRWSFARRFIKRTNHVLEVGCGQDKPLSKILTGGAAANVDTYVGVDLNPLKPSNSQRLTFLGEFNFVTKYKEVQKLRPEGFDVVVHFEVIEHMSVANGRKMLNAMFKVLKPGGVMLMSTPCYDGVRHAANHIHEYTIPELTKMTEKAKFVIEDRFGTFMDIKVQKKEEPDPKYGLTKKEVQNVYRALSKYFDNDAVSNIFGPLYPDHARNNLWVCRKPE